MSRRCLGWEKTFRTLSSTVLRAFKMMKNVGIFVSGKVFPGSCSEMQVSLADIAGITACSDLCIPSFTLKDMKYTVFHTEL